MSDFFKNNPKALRHCILFEVLQGAPIEEAYSKFRNTLGEDFMKYREFEFWYHRFVNGEYDLNIEMNKDKKIYELMDMPIHVMDNIVEYLDIFDRANLVQTSRSLQTFVKDQKLFHHTIKLNVLNNMATVSFGKSVNIKYIKNYAACRKIYKNRETNFRGVAYWKQANRDIKKFLNKNPKLYLEALNIASKINNKHLFNDLENVLKFAHHLHVKKLNVKLYSLDKLLNIIPSLKPGYLTTINIYSGSPDVDSMNRIFETEQWKKAKYFRMNGWFIWPLRNLYHFKEFATGLEKLSVEDVREMKEILFKSSNFEKCSLYISSEIDAFNFRQEFGNALSEIPHAYHYPIPHSNDYFEIEVRFSSIAITRKKA